MVNSDTSLMAFGRYLKSMRMQMGIPIEAVSKELKISVRQLSLIEEEAHENLPDEVYVKGILRAYARYIGVDADDIVERYLISRSEYGKQSAENNFLGYGTTRLYRLGLLIIGVAIVSIITIYLVPASFQSATDDRKSENVEPVGLQKMIDPGDSVDVSTVEKQEEKLFLQIDAVEDTNLKIIIDDGDPLKYLLHPLDHMELEASSTINLLLDNADGVRILFNGKPVSTDENNDGFINIELP